MHTLALMNITEYQLKYQLMQITNTYINIINNLWIYFIILSTILIFISCFLPCLLCKTIRNIPCIILRFIICCRCKKTKNLINRFDPYTLKDRQLLISP